ncbi:MULTISPECIES: TVP38/TMEM64 family protein [unclassified Campylobacter]|uniref:TVP38/TMEM64 family protein n=1 Tax=unclassified Campylobacter TaxID=2593542 RepID=UPI0014514DE0|nr:MULTISPECIES: TVP38/TMEM64 family protein [unclassified Campylobacter]QCD53141.1 putative membrane protein, YdjX family (SNARE domain) [Campylobacter sp. RM16192]
MLLKFLKPILFVTIISGTLYFIDRIGISELKIFIGEHKIFAPLLYILCFAILPIFFFPVPILAVVAGAAFGLLMGSLYTILGAMINSILMFYIARILGFNAVKNLFEYSQSKALKALARQSSKFSLILILRLMPLVPYNALNYACGLMNVELKEYMLATFVGIVPATFIMVNLGEKMLDVHSNEFTIALILMVILVFVSSFGARWIKRIKSNDFGNSADL